MSRYYNLDSQLRYVEDLDDDIQRSLIWYTGGSFDTFNERLRRGEEIHGEDRKHFLNIVKAFMGVPILNSPILVYRGINTDRVYHEDKAFVSTSLNYESALEFSGNTCCMLNITVPAGTKALPLYTISNVKSEDEVLLDKNGTFNVTSSDIIKNMKNIFVTYTPQKILQKTNKVEEVKDPGKDDTELVIKRLIEFLIKNTEDEDEDDKTDNFYILTKVNNILKIRNLSLSKDQKDYIVETVIKHNSS